MYSILLVNDLGGDERKTKESKLDQLFMKLKN